MSTDRLIPHLGRAARRRRESADLLIAEICARLRHDTGVKKTDSALSRFERGETTPSYLDDVIAAYAAETGDDAIDYWIEAIESMRGATAAAGKAMAAAAAALEVQAQEAARQQGADTAAPAPRKRAARKRRAGG